MQIENYFIENDGKISFSREMGSNFAKRVAGDFNPIHDEDNKRFCVPGDLLFSVLLHKFGINQTMQVSFSGMVNDSASLNFIEAENSIQVQDDKGKDYLTIERSGQNTQNPQLINDIIEKYVTFSGQTFPHILVPLMEESGMMINPARPLVIYENMRLELDDLKISQPTLEISHSELSVEGKRGTATLAFNILSNDKKVGRGSKQMVLSSLRAYDAEQMNSLAEKYDSRKKSYFR